MKQVVLQVQVSWYECFKWRKSSLVVFQIQFENLKKKNETEEERFDRKLVQDFEVKTLFFSLNVETLKSSKLRFEDLM